MTSADGPAIVSPTDYMPYLSLLPEVGAGSSTPGTSPCPCRPPCGTPCSAVMFRDLLTREL